MHGQMLRKPEAEGLARREIRIWALPNVGLYQGVLRLLAYMGEVTLYYLVTGMKTIVRARLVDEAPFIFLQDETSIRRILNLKMRDGNFIKQPCTIVSIPRSC